jgi:membrane associated rhomboid family serine protease
VPALRVSEVERSASPHFISRLFFSINIVLYILMVLTELNSGRPGAEAFFEGASGPVLVDFGSCVPQLFFHGEWWRVVTPNFLHLGLIHLAVNSVVLYMLGPQVEEIYGSQKFIVIYLTTGVFSMVVSSLFGFGGGGASGSLSGLIGLLAAYGYRLGGPFGRALMRQMLFWALIGLLPVSMFGGRVNWVAHGAGAVAGGALGLVISSVDPVTARANRWWNISAVGCALLIMGSFVMVAIDYGKMQRVGDLQAMEYAASKAERVLEASFSWNPRHPASPPAATTPKTEPTAEQVAAELRVAASGLEKIPSLDPRADQIKRDLVNLIQRRVAAIEGAANDPSAAMSSVPADRAELLRLHDELIDWIGETLEKYGVERPRARPRGPVS